jgi:hypothetical protein
MADKSWTARAVQGAAVHTVLLFWIGPLAAAPCSPGYADITVTESVKFENAAFTDTSKFFYERIRKIGDLRLQSVQRAFEAQFATKTVEERKAADFLVALDGGPLPNGQTRYAYPSKPADYAYLVGLCPRGRKDGGIVEYDCSWKFFEVSGGCSVAPEINDSFWSV